MNIAVIGLGAVGMFVASELHERHNVTCYTRREEQKHLLLKEGLIYNQRKISVDAKTINELSSHDLYIVCVKQTELDSVLPYLQNSSEEAYLLFLQNGLGHLHKIEALPQRIFIGVNENGVLRLSDNEVKRTGIGIIKLSGLTEIEKPYEAKLVDELANADFAVEKSNDLFHTMREKLVVNSVINPLTAIFNVKNGEIVANRFLNKIAHQLTEEACEALDLDVNFMWEKVTQIAKNTKENYSSMAIDIQRGRKTEIDYINGYLIKHSPKLISHQLMYDLVKGKENLSHHDN